LGEEERKADKVLAKARRRLGPLAPVRLGDAGIVGTLLRADSILENP
jgi:hypothetical protein